MLPLVVVDQVAFKPLSPDTHSPEMSLQMFGILMGEPKEDATCMPELNELPHRSKRR
jgi:hypothetical protein